MATYKIAVMPGDGTGPEVRAEAVKVLKAAAAKFKFKLDLTEFDFGGERYKRTLTLPDSALTSKFDAICWRHRTGRRAESRKRHPARGHFEPDQYKPAPVFIGRRTPKEANADIDFAVVKQRPYTGTGVTMKGTPHEAQSAVYSRFQVDRSKYAFEYACKHGKKARGKSDKNTLALCGKTNVLTYIYGLWERAFHEMGKAEYPEIAREYYHVDATCMWMVKNPEWFDVLSPAICRRHHHRLGVIQGGRASRRCNLNPKACVSRAVGGSAHIPAKALSIWRRFGRANDA
jgi:3-isopropylmalate dehydrogenase